MLGDDGIYRRIVTNVYAESLTTEINLKQVRKKKNYVGPHKQIQKKLKCIH